VFRARQNRQTEKPRIDNITILNWGETGDSGKRPGIPRQKREETALDWELLAVLGIERKNIRRKKRVTTEKSSRKVIKRRKCSVGKAEQKVLSPKGSQKNGPDMKKTIKSRGP